MSRFWRIWVWKINKTKELDFALDILAEFWRILVQLKIPPKPGFSRFWTTPSKENVSDRRIPLSIITRILVQILWAAFQNLDSGESCAKRPGPKACPQTL